MHSKSQETVPKGASHVVLPARADHSEVWEVLRDALRPPTDGVVSNHASRPFSPPKVTGIPGVEDHSAVRTRLRQIRKRYGTKSWPTRPAEELSMFGRVLDVGEHGAAEGTVDLPSERDPFRGVRKLPTWRAPPALALRMELGSEMAEGVYGSSDPRPEQVVDVSDEPPPVTSRRPDHTIWKTGISRRKGDAVTERVVGRGFALGSGTSKRAEFARIIREDRRLGHSDKPLEDLVHGRHAWRHGGLRVSDEYSTKSQAFRRHLIHSSFLPGVAHGAPPTMAKRSTVSLKGRLHAVLAAATDEACREASMKRAASSLGLAGGVDWDPVLGGDTVAEWAARVRRKAERVGLPPKHVEHAISMALHKHLGMPKPSKVRHTPSRLKRAPTSKLSSRRGGILKGSRDGDSVGIDGGGDIGDDEDDEIMRSLPPSAKHTLAHLPASLDGFSAKEALRESGGLDRARQILGWRFAAERSLMHKKRKDVEEEGGEGGGKGRLSISIKSKLPDWLVSKISKYEESLGERGMKMDVEAAWTSALRPPKSRTESHVQAIALFIRACPFAEGLDVSSVLDIARGTLAYSADVGQVVIRQGDIAEDFYIQMTGRCSITVAKLGVVAQTGPGESFGERGLLAENHRSATVTAVEPSQLLRVTRDTFKGAIHSLHQRRQAALSRMAMINPLINSWHPGLISKFTGSAQVLDVPSGGLIAKQGEVIQHILMVLTGTVAIRHRISLVSTNSWPSDAHRGYRARRAHVSAEETIGELREGALIGVNPLLDVPEGEIPRHCVTFRAATATRMLKIDAVVKDLYSREGIRDGLIESMRNRRYRRISRLEHAPLSMLVLQASSDTAGNTHSGVSVANPPSPTRTGGDAKFFMDHRGHTEAVTSTTVDDPMELAKQALALNKDLVDDEEERKERTDTAVNMVLRFDASVTEVSDIEDDDDMDVGGGDKKETLGARTRLLKHVATVTSMHHRVPVPENLIVTTKGIFFYSSASTLGRGPGDEPDSATLAHLSKECREEALDARRKVLLAFQPTYPSESDAVLRRVLSRVSNQRARNVLADSTSRSKT